MPNLNGRPRKGKAGSGRRIPRNLKPLSRPQPDDSPADFEDEFVDDTPDIYPTDHEEEFVDDTPDEYPAELDDPVSAVTNGPHAPRKSALWAVGELDSLADLVTAGVRS